MEPKKIPNANDILAAHLIPKKPEQSAPTEPKVDTSSETANKVEVKVEEPKVAMPPAPTPEVTIDDWDKDEPAPSPVTDESKFDFATLIKDTGIEAKDLTEFKEKIKTPKPAVDEWQGVPDNLKKAVELAKKGADYLSFLKVASVDYSKVDPIQLYEQSIKSDPSYTPEEAKELLESMSPLQKKAQGIQLQKSYTSWQQAQVAEHEASVARLETERNERKQRADKELRSTLDKVEKIAGLSLKPSHKQDIYDAITTGRMQRELFFNEKSGEYDYQSMIETYFVKKNLPKILEHVKKVTSSDTLRGFVKDVTNATVDKPKEAPEPSQPEKKSQLEQYIESLKARK